MSAKSTGGSRLVSHPALWETAAGVQEWKINDRTHWQDTCRKGHTQACGEARDGEDVVEAARGHQQRGDALLHAVAVLLQQQHGRNHHGGRDGPQHKAATRGGGG